MRPKRPKQYTEREAKRHAQERGRSIEALTPNPMGYASARKRLPSDGSGFLIWDEETSKYVPAVLVGVENERHIELLMESWDGADMQGWDGPGWYFWDETQAYCHGPFDTKGQASEALNVYAKELG